MTAAQLTESPEGEGQGSVLSSSHRPQKIPVKTLPRGQERLVIHVNSWSHYQHYHCIPVPFPRAMKAESVREEVCVHQVLTSVLGQQGVCV
jgi:hypothetical protein